MLHPQNMELKTTWSEDTELLLPKITSLIFEGLHTDVKGRDTDFKLFRNSKQINQDGVANRFRLPVSDSTRREISISKLPGSSSGGSPICITHHHGQLPFMRTFIGGLSHHYNNLLMGIWGNVSLFGMLLEKNHPVQIILLQIEGLIQNGSSLIHLLFGYLIERRTTTKRLRLNQLIQEIKTYNQISGNEIDFTTIETSVVELSKIRNKTQLASCMARVMDQMLTLIQEKRILIDAQGCLDSPKVLSHLEKIDHLLMCGFQMIRKLDYYAENIAPQKKWVSLKPIVSSLTHHFNHRNVKISQDLSASIPRVRIDDRQIAFALKQLVDNALDAIADDGKIHIQVDTLQSEKPQDRCGLHMLNNYVVITVSDNGIGITMSMQAKIFNPFFANTTPQGEGRAGLGLSAAAGIIKSHGGYIQVRSKHGSGSVFKIYLP